VGAQIRGLVEKRLENGLLTHLHELEDIFISEHGFALRVDLCGAADVRDLVIDALSPWVKLDGDVIRIPMNSETSQASVTTSHPMTGEELISSYAEASRKNPTATVSDVEKNLAQLSLLSVSNDELEKKIQQIRIFGEEMSVLLEESGGSLGIQIIHPAYEQK